MPACGLVADIGGTNARFALVDLTTGALERPQSSACAGHASLHAAAAAYLASVGERPREAVFAVAGPVTDGFVTLTNSGWRAGEGELADALGLERLAFVNDFAALSRSLPTLATADLRPLGGGEAVPHAPKVVVGPGTGLGVGGLLHLDGRWLPVPSEGGHADFAAADAAEQALAERVRGEHGHVSVERMVSGPGLGRVHAMLAADRGRAGATLGPAEIVAAALAGSDPAAERSVTLFARWLCRFAGDAALFFAARGGVYLGGGIPPRILPFLERPDMRAAFESKGRMSGLLAAMPLSVIVAPDAGLRGAAAFLLEEREPA